MTHGPQKQPSSPRQIAAQVRQAGREVALADAAKVALSHVEELRDAWARGAIEERDGRGGTRSNRNVEVEAMLRKALEATQ